MAQQTSQIRTVFECIGILAVLYIVFGGQASQLFGSIEQDEDLPLSQEKTESLVYPDRNLQCATHKYNAHIFSTSPLIIYIPEFLSHEESKHMIRIRYAE